jgi:hypothetical protein
MTQRPGEQAERRDDGAGQALVALADDDGQIDHVRPGQELAKAELGVEFLGRHPAPLLDQHAPGKGQHAAETGQADRGKAQKKRPEVRAERVRRPCGQGRFGKLSLPGGTRPTGVRRQAFALRQRRAMRPSVCAPAFDTLIRLVRFWKS